MIKKLFFAAFLFSIFYSISAHCNQNIEFKYSQTKPKSITAEDSVLIDLTVGWQTGCTIPDLSKSPKAGSTTLKVFLDQHGSPRIIKVEETTGTPTDNNIITAAIKHCNFSKRVGIEDVPSDFYITFKVKWDKGDNTPNVGLQTCLRRPTAPHIARHLNLKGNVIVKWGIRPTLNHQFEKKLMIDSGSKHLNNHIEKELDRCLKNPDVAQSIRDNYKDGLWEEFGAEFQFEK